MANQYNESVINAIYTIYPGNMRHEEQIKRRATLVASVTWPDGGCAATTLKSISLIWKRIPVTLQYQTQQPLI
jgi:hypothetical protein